MPAAHMRKKHASLSRYNTGQLIGDPPKHLLNCGWPPNCSLCVSQMLTSGGGLPAAQVTCTLSCSNYPLGMDVSKKYLIVLRLQLGLQQSNSHVWMALCWFMQVLICWIFLQLVFLGLHFYDVLHVLLVPKGEEQRVCDLILSKFLPGWEAKVEEQTLGHHCRCTERCQFR